MSDLSLDDLDSDGLPQSSDRLQILSHEEYELLWGFPRFIRLETLKEANARIANATVRLPMFRHFDIDEAEHSSSDGQKFEVAIPTINARHSSKYFGLKKGVVAYTLLANHVPINARIIGANEHESHFGFGILFNNATDILPAIHSTDTHGANHVKALIGFRVDRASGSVDLLNSIFMRRYIPYKPMCCMARREAF